MDMYEDYELDDRNSRKRKIDKEQYDDDTSDSIEVMVKRDIMPLFSDDEPVIKEKPLYGLNAEYLNSLGITSPFDKWVQVTNFRCDKSELRDVLELAGHVVTCALITANQKCAKVMYSHPLEAVQAISMLNGQTLYGQQLKVTMLNHPSDTVILPKGLTDVGPGLGNKGKPLREIVKHYQRFIKNKKSDINVKLFGDGFNYSNEKNYKKEPNMRDDSSDDDKINKGFANKNLSYLKGFKVTNVEEIDESSTENSTKKAKLYSKDSLMTNVDSSKIIPETENMSSYKTHYEKGELTQKPSYFSENINNEGSNVQHQIVTLTRSHSAPKCFPPVISRPYQNPGLGSPRPSIGSIASITNVNIRPPDSTMGSPGIHINPCSFPGPSVPRPGFIGVETCTVLNMSMGPSVSPPGSFGPPPGPRMIVRSTLAPRLIATHMIPVCPQMGSPNLCTLYFRNLPPSTTFPLLSEKVSHCGQVVSVQLTTPGCAIVKFVHSAHAQRCYQLFNGLCIDGHVVEVRIG